MALDIEFASCMDSIVQGSQDFPDDGDYNTCFVFVVDLVAVFVINSYLNYFLRRTEQDIIKAWVVKLLDLRYTEEQKATRNEYGNALARLVVVDKVLRPPFNTLPPDGPLDLNPDLSFIKYTIDSNAGAVGGYGRPPPGVGRLRGPPTPGAAAGPGAAAAPAAAPPAAPGAAARGGDRLGESQFMNLPDSTRSNVRNGTASGRSADQSGVRSSISSGRRADQTGARSPNASSRRADQSGVRSPNRSRAADDGVPLNAPEGGAANRSFRSPVAAGRREDQAPAAAAGPAAQANVRPPVAAPGPGNQPRVPMEPQFATFNSGFTGADQSRSGAVNASGARSPNASAARAANASGVRAANASGVGAANMSGARAANASGVGAANVSGAGVANVSGARAANVSGVGAANVSGARAANVSGVGAANVSGVGAANVSGVGAANVSGARAANVSGVGAANVSGAGAANVSGAGAANVSGAGAAPGPGAEEAPLAIDNQGVPAAALYDALAGIQDGAAAPDGYVDDAAADEIVARADDAAVADGGAGQQPRYMYRKMPCAGKATGAIPKTRKSRSPPPPFDPSQLYNEFEDPEEMARVIARSKGQSFAEFVAAVSRHTRDFGQGLRTAMKSETTSFRDYVDNVLSQRIKDLTDVLDEEQNRELLEIKRDVEKWELELTNVKKRIGELVPGFDVDLYRKDINYVKKLFTFKTGFAPEEDSFKRFKEESTHRLKWINEMIANVTRCNEEARKDLAKIRDQSTKFQVAQVQKQQDVSNFIQNVLDEYLTLKRERDDLIKENNELMTQLQEFDV